MAYYTCKNKDCSWFDKKQHMYDEPNSLRGIQDEKGRFIGMKCEECGESMIEIPISSSFSAVIGKIASMDIHQKHQYFKSRAAKHASSADEVAHRRQVDRKQIGL